MNILEEAHNIVFDRSEEKEREYGNFHESMERAAAIAGTNIESVYMHMIGLKLARLQFKWKRDSALDLVAYVASYDDYVKQNER